MFQPPLNGLIAATTTPLADDGSIKLDAIGPTIDRLVDRGVRGFYVCGSTGEGMSLTSDERRSIVAETVQSVGGRATVIVQVGHNSLSEANQLARHAESVGADVISATCPSYFKISDTDSLCQSTAAIAKGTALPFYYYHIPSLTGSQVDVLEFLERADAAVPTLVGMKYTAPLLHEFQSCQYAVGGRFDIVWGCDEMLLGALATGARAAIGSTYNLAAPLYRQLIEAFESGDLQRARALQFRSVQLVNVMQRYPFHAALKQIMAMIGFHGGPCRLPLRRLSNTESARLRQELELIGFFEWCGMPRDDHESA